MMTTSTDTIAHTCSKDCLLDLFMCHAAAGQVGCRQSLTQLRNVYCSHHKERAYPVPHIMLLIKFGIRSGPKVHLVLLELLQGQLQATLFLQRNQCQNKDRIQLDRLTQEQQEAGWSSL